jgi:hypothetical protein
MYLFSENGEIHTQFSSCVGSYIPLHRYLPAEQYHKVRDNTIEHAILDKNIYTTSEWFVKKFDTTEFVPITNISIKQGQHWERFQLIPPFSDNLKAK